MESPSEEVPGWFYHAAFMPIGESTGIAPRTNTEHGLIRQKGGLAAICERGLEWRVREEAYV